MPKQDIAETIKIRSLNTEIEPLDDIPLYKNIEIVPLEINDECIVGMISKLIIKDSLVFIADHLKNLFVFNRQGQFLNRIGSLLQIKDNIKEKKNMGLKELDAVLKTLREDDNPVLIFYTLDENY